MINMQIYNEFLLRVLTLAHMLQREKVMMVKSNSIMVSIFCAHLMCWRGIGINPWH